MKKTLVFLLTLIVLVALSGCKKTETKIIPGDNDPFGKYDNLTTIELVRTSDASIESDILSYYNDETLQNNRFTNLFEEELNIKITYKFIAANPEQYRTKLNLAMSINDLPDFMMVDPQQIKQLNAAEQLIDLTEYWETYASDLLKEITTQEGNQVLEAATIDGKLLGIPQMFSSIDRAQFLWIRTDWIDKINEDNPNLNLPKEPKTIDDLEKIARAFMTEDPDGNGRDDTYGIINQGNLWADLGGLTALFNSYDAYPNIWVESDGKLEFGSIQPEVKETLAKLSEMYNEGIIHREFATQTSDTIADKIKTSKVGIVFGEQWTCAWPIQDLYNINPNTEWKALPLVSSDNDKNTKTQITMGTYGWWAASKSSQHPEAIIKLMNTYVESIWGENNDFDKYYMPEETGLPVWKLSPINPEPPTKNLDAYLSIKNAIENETEDTLVGEAKQIFDQIQKFEAGDKKFWSWSKGYNPLDEPVYESMKFYHDNELFQYNQYNTAPTETMVDRMSFLQDEQNRVFTGIINGTKSLDDFDKFVDDWNRLGGEDITKEVNDWYKSIK